MKDFYLVRTEQDNVYTIMAAYDDFVGAVYGQEELTFDESYWLADESTMQSLLKDFPESVKVGDQRW